MHMLLIFLMYLCTTVYFTALQAGDWVQFFSDQIALTEKEDVIDQKKEDVLNPQISIQNMVQLVLLMNKVIQNIAVFGQASKEFLAHPATQITEAGAKMLRDLFSGENCAHQNKSSCVYSANAASDISTNVDLGMHSFTTKRINHVRNSLHKHFDIALHGSHVPKIAIAASGGGIRACLITAGFLAGAEQTGLLDCVMYNAAISGGSWAVGSASYLFAKSYPRVTFTEFKNNLAENLDKGFAIPGSSDYMPPYITHLASSGIARNLFTRAAWDQPITSMELWGALIANVVLQGVDGWDQSSDGQRFDVKFSDIAPALQQGVLPLPMLATVVPINSSKKGKSSGYKWMAFTPLRAGTKDIGGYVPMWAMGRSYIENQSDLMYRGCAPEYPLSYLLGACGSAFNINLKYFFGDQQPSLEVQGFQIPIPINIHEIADLRFYPYKIYNFTKDIPGAPLVKNEHMTMVDGGICCNIPLSLVAKPEDTAADIIIIVDADLNAVNETGTSETLNSINRYFEENNPGIMPKLDSQISLKLYKQGKVFHIFNDPRSADYDSKLPVIIYFPFIRNKDYSQTFDPAGFALKIHPEVGMMYKGHNHLSTFNFKYTQSQAQMVADLMECNVKQSMFEIKEVLQSYMKQH